MSIEGGTRLPAFLVHDSPREADLGLSVYHRLFHLARNLEQGEGQTLFKYIVTTTTRPPDELSDQPWLRDKLGGAPAEARLLRRDL
ncbi:MAG: chromosome segregation protein SMC, partial [Proteobacteria bacterium]|nr:chromosome segregation protein SMC [Pseudomonadota bacterium]